MQARRTGPDGTTTFHQLSTNSPLHEHLYAAWEGGESHADQKRGCERIVAFTQAVLDANGVFTFDAASSANGEVQVRIEFAVGGDYPWVASMTRRISGRRVRACLMRPGS